MIFIYTKYNFDTYEGSPVHTKKNFGVYNKMHPFSITARDSIDDDVVAINDEIEGMEFDEVENSNEVEYERMEHDGMEHETIEEEIEDEEDEEDIFEDEEAEKKRDPDWCLPSSDDESDQEEEQGMSKFFFSI